MIKSSITNIILDLTLYALLSVIWLSVPSYSWAKGDDRLITNGSVLYIPHSVHHGHCKKAVDIGIKPSSPNIHIQILQTDLHIFPYRISIGNSMICSDIWHKYHEWYFEIVLRNFTSRLASEIWDNFEIWRVVFVPNITYKSCYYLFILLPATIL